MMPKVAPTQPEIPVLTRPRPASKARFWQAQVGLVPTKIVGTNPKRMALSIMNLGAANIFIDNKIPNVNISFILPGGAVVALDNYIGEIWLVAAAPLVVSLIEMEL